MLVELYGQNFGCFRDEFRLSLLATDIDPESSRGLVNVTVEDDDEPIRLLRAVALYGPNGSGKSTVLRAAAALHHLIAHTGRLRSDSPLEMYEPFALGKRSKDPVRLGVKVIIDHHVYDYEIRFDRTKFVSERLVWLKPDREVVLLDRSFQEVTGEWTKYDRFSLLSKDFRPNALLLSLADRLTPALTKKIAVKIRRLLTPSDGGLPAWFFERDSPVAKRAREDSEFNRWLLSQLRAADIGVVDLQTEEVRMQTFLHFGNEEVLSNSASEGDAHVRTSYRLSLLHRGSDGAFPIPYNRESSGTKRLVEIAPLLYDLAHELRPKAVFVDEIDASLHPVLLKGIVGHFNCEVPLPKVRGQLVFVAHETSLLDAEAKDAVLRRDQVYLTEKDASGAARLYSVAEFRERNNLNLRRRYLQGRYGALPSLGSFSE